MLMILMEKKKKSERKVCQIVENVYICNRKSEKCYDYDSKYVHSMVVALLKIQQVVSNVAVWI